MLLMHIRACSIGPNELGGTAQLAWELAVDPETDDVWLLHTPMNDHDEPPGPGAILHIEGESHHLEEVKRLEMSNWPQLAFSAAGPLLAWTDAGQSTTKSRVELYDRESLGALAERGLPSSSMVLSPSTEAFLSPFDEGAVVVDARLDRRAQLEAEHITWLPDGTLGSVSDDLLVQTWDLDGLNELSAVQLDLTDLNSEAPYITHEVHPSREQLAVVVSDGGSYHLRVVELASGQVHAVPQLGAGRYSGDGSVYVQATPTELKVLDTESLELDTQSLASVDNGRGIWVSEDGSWVVVQGVEGALSLVDPATGTHTAYSWDVGSFVVRGSELWSVYEGQLGVLEVSGGELQVLELGTELQQLGHARNQDQIVVRSSDGEELIWVDPETHAVVASKAL